MLAWAMGLGERDLLLLFMATVGLIGTASLLPGAEIQKLGRCVLLCRVSYDHQGQQSVAKGPSWAVYLPGLTELPGRSQCGKLLRRPRWRSPVQCRWFLLLLVTSGRC